MKRPIRILQLNVQQLIKCQHIYVLIPPPPRSIGFSHKIKMSKICKNFENLNFYEKFSFLDE